MENETLNLQMFKMEGPLASQYAEMPETTRTAAAIEELAKQPALASLQRYAARQSNEYERARKTLLETRKHFPLAPPSHLREPAQTDPQPSTPQPEPTPEASDPQPAVTNPPAQTNPTKPDAGGFVTEPAALDTRTVPPLQLPKDVSDAIISISLDRGSYHEKSDRGSTISVARGSCRSGANGEFGELRNSAR